MSQPYSDAFYSQQSAGSLSSARAIAPIAIELVAPTSVVDVGCGVGTWAHVFNELGVDDVFGLDGDYVDRDALLIDASRFQAADLTKGVDCGRSFDLAVSLEVGEHLPPECSQQFVRDLTRLAPAVLFSAAVPFQGGSAHINERWQDDWAAMFEAEGYVAIDAIRQRVWTDPNVEFWYAQNAILYVRRDRLDDYPALAGAGSDWPLRMVHPQLYELQNAGRPQPSWVTRAPRRLGAKVARRAHQYRTRSA
jgi:SAM-dependent methyltransferase